MVLHPFLIFANERFRVVDQWGTETTDPSKFIHEDLGIAAYLILIWGQDRRDKDNPVRFADLGCGNGLLVYILGQVSLQNIRIAWFLDDFEWNRNVGTDISS